MTMEARKVGWELALCLLSGSRMYIMSISSGQGRTQTASGAEGGKSALVAWEQLSGKYMALSSTFTDTETYLP